MSSTERDKEQSKWIANYNIYKCKLNHNRTEIESIGGLPMDNISLSVIPISSN